MTVDTKHMLMSILFWVSISLPDTTNEAEIEKRDDKCTKLNQLHIRYISYVVKAIAL